MSNKKFPRLGGKITRLGGQGHTPGEELINHEDKKTPGTPKIDLTSSEETFVRNLLDRTGLDKPLEITAKDVMAWPEDPLDWIQTQFYVPELNGPLILFPYQQAVLREAYRRDENGNFVYDTVVWSDIKKSLKSVIAAAVVAERARHLSWGQMRMIGNSREQAASRSFFYLQRAIKLNSALRKTVVSRQYTILYPNRTSIQAIPMNPNSQAGGNDSMIVYTETWAADPSLIERMFIEMTIPPNLFGKSQRWLESYAGYSGVSTLLERLYRAGVKEGELLDVGFPGLELYANKQARLLVLWNTVPRLPWQTQVYYESEASIISPSEFSRVHRNQWVSTTKEFVPRAWWDACRQSLPPMDKFEQVIIGVDAAVSSDSFGIVVVSRHGDKVAVRDVREWKPVRGKIEFTNFDDPTDPEYPEGFVRMLVNKYNVIALVYDPYQLEHFCGMLMADNLVWCVPFNQGPARAVADKKLYDLIRNRSLVHDDNRALTEHILNADSTADGSEKLRIVKRSPVLKIDLAVALSMASDKALELLAP